MFGFRDTALVYLSYVVAGLLVTAVSFALFALNLRARTALREKRWRRLSDRWRAPVLLALTEPSTMDAVHDVIPPRDRLHFVRFVLEYAQRVRGNEREILGRLAKPYLAPLGERVWSRHSEVRTRAVRTLGMLGLPDHTDEVVGALDDPSPLVAMIAAKSLARKEHAEHAADILLYLKRFEGWSRNFMASMLASIGPDAAPALRASLASETEVIWVRAVSAEALRMLRDPYAADTAAQVVEIEEDRELLASALRLLSEVGRPTHVTVVRVRCASPDFVIRSHALTALGIVGGEEDIPRIEEALGDESPWVAIHAARALKAAGREDILEELADAKGPRALLARQVLSEEVLR
ncbi:MAG: HEAT repeat domain-containing protein [Gemmatimonadota bacterium]|nr:HEAT repeat domain-containing protein [Gemmatimonadota bacterium]